MNGHYATRRNGKMNSGTTHDDLKVVEAYGLKLLWTWPTWQKTAGFSIGIDVEFNANADGKKFPYIVLSFGTRASQIGWLWG
jgi:hypothetical protein